MVSQNYLAENMFVKPLFFVLIFSLIFAPKIGLVDLSIVISGFCLVLLAPFQAKFHVDKRLFLAGIIVLFLSFYQIFITVIFLENDFLSVFRLIRAAMVAFLMALAGVVAARMRIDLIRILFYAILIHSALIVLAANSIALNEMLGYISGNDRIRPYRASGLMAGFDMAGFISIIGLLLLAFNAVKIDLKAKFIFLFLLLLSCYFTSRVSMVLGLLVVGGFIFHMIKNRNYPFFYRFVFFVFSSVLLYFYLLPIINIFEVTFNLGLVDVDQELVDEIVANHARQHSDRFLWEHMLFLPNSLSGIIFGVGYNPLKSDVGYVKELFRYGLVGMLVMLSVHLFLIFSTLGNAGATRLEVKYKYFIGFVFVLMLTLSWKNNYFFTRGIWPIFLILVSSLPYIGISEKLGQKTGVLWRKYVRL